MIDSIADTIRNNESVLAGKVPLKYLAHLGVAVAKEAGVTRFSSLETIIGNPNVYGEKTADELMRSVFDPLAFIGLADHEGLSHELKASLPSAVERLVESGVLAAPTNGHHALLSLFHEPGLLVSAPVHLDPSAQTQIVREKVRFALVDRSRRQNRCPEWRERSILLKSNSAFYSAREVKIALASMPAYSEPHLTTTLADWEDAYRRLMGTDKGFAHLGFEGSLKGVHTEAYYGGNVQKPMPVVNAYPEFVQDGDRLAQTTAAEWLIRRMRILGMEVSVDPKIQNIKTDVLAVSEAFRRLAKVSVNGDDMAYTPETVQKLSLPLTLLDSTAGVSTINFVSLLFRRTNAPHLIPGTLVGLETTLAYFYFLYDKKKAGRLSRGCENFSNTDSCKGKTLPVGNITADGRHVTVVWDGERTVHISAANPYKFEYNSALLLAGTT